MERTDIKIRVFPVDDAAHKLGAKGSLQILTGVGKRDIDDGSWTEASAAAEDGNDEMVEEVLFDIANNPQLSEDEIESVLKGLHVSSSDTASKTVEDSKKEEHDKFLALFLKSMDGLRSADMVAFISSLGVRRLDHDQIWQMYSELVDRGEDSLLALRQYSILVRYMVNRLDLAERIPDDLPSQIKLILRNMKKFGIKPDMTIYTCLLKTHKDDIQGIKVILEYLEKQDVPWTQEYVQTLIRLYSRKTRLMPQLPQLFNAMKKKELKPTISTLCLFLEGFGKCKNQEYTMKAHSLINVLYYDQWDRNVYNNLMMAWNQCSQIKTVQRLHAEMISRGIAPNRDTYKILLSVYYAQNFWRAIVSIYNNRFLYYKIPLDDECWKYVLTAYAGLADVQSLKFKAQMNIKSQLLGQYPAVTLHSLMLCCEIWAVLGDLDGIESAFKDIVDVKTAEYKREGKIDLEYRPPKYLLGLMISSLVKAESWDRASSFIGKYVYSDENIRYHFVKTLRKAKDRDDEVYAATTMSSKRARKAPEDVVRDALCAELWSSPFETLYKSAINAWVGEYRKTAVADKTGLRSMLIRLREMEKIRVKEVLDKYEIQI